MTVYGYARVSTQEQTLDNQHAQLTQAGAQKVFSEKESGAKADRKALAKALKALEPGDVLLVTRLDRLARSTMDLLNTLDTIAKAGAGFRSLAEVWCDTSSAYGRLLITVLAGVAEFERELILARCNDGRKVAMSKGIRFGRPPKLTRFQVLEAKRMLAEGHSQTEVGRLLGVSHSTISRVQ